MSTSLFDLQEKHEAYAKVKEIVEFVTMSDDYLWFQHVFQDLVGMEKIQLALQVLDQKQSAQTAHVAQIKQEMSALTHEIKVLNENLSNFFQILANMGKE